MDRLEEVKKEFKNVIASTAFKNDIAWLIKEVENKKLASADKGFLNMKIDIEKIRLGISPLTGSVYAYIPDKEGNAKHKKDVTEDFKAIIEKLDKPTD